MGLGLQPRIGRATFWLNSLVVRLVPQRRHLLVLTYHRIGNRQQLHPEAADLAECSAEEFEAEMEWLRRSCSILDLSDLRAVVRGHRPCPSRAVFVTFDDGYREDLLRVRPCLKRLGIRPIVFLPTDYVGTTRRFWWDRISVAVQLSQRRQLATRLNGDSEDLPLTGAEERATATARLVDHAKQLPGSDERELFIAELERLLEVPDTRTAGRPLIVSWEEARELTSVFDFGAHTLSHPVLSQLSAAAARRELAGSKAEVERRLGVPCPAVAIPYGLAGDYTKETVRLAGEAGYELIFSLEETLRGPKRHGDLHLVDRIALSARGGLPVMALKLTWPSLFVPSWTDRTRHLILTALGRR